MLKQAAQENNTSGWQQKQSMLRTKQELALAEQSIIDYREYALKIKNELDQLEQN